jgi:hypothetical protein
MTDQSVIIKRQLPSGDRNFVSRLLCSTVRGDSRHPFGDITDSWSAKEEDVDARQNPG